MRCLCLLALLFAAPARAAPVLSGTIERVVAAGGHVAVLRDGEVRVLGEDGRPLFHIAAEGSTEEEPRRRRVDAQAVHDLYDLPESERDGELAEELADDELTLRDRRPAIPPPADARPPRLAAGDRIWIVARGALWRVGSAGEPRRCAASLPPVDHLAAAAGRVLVADGPRLWESRDDGATFQVIERAERTIRAVAARGNALAVATDRLLFFTGDDGEPGSLSLPEAPRDLLFCDSTLLVLHRLGLLAVAPDGAVTDVPVTGARRLACAPDGRWTVAGPRLLVGAAGQLAPRADVPPHAVLDAAWGERCLWLATSAGLSCLPHQESARAPVAERGELFRRVGAAAAWASWLPRLALGASFASRAEHQDARAFALAELPLGQRPGGRRRTHIAALAAEVADGGAAEVARDSDARCLPRARAAAVARALAEPERARSLVERARLAAWLPELRVRIDRRLGRNESLDVPAGATEAVGPLGLDTANDVRYEARATWDLSRLVFSSDEVGAAAQALRMAEMRREIESLANRLYFERRRLKMEPADIADAQGRTRREVRVEELDAELDAVSGGAFGRCLAGAP